MTFNRAFIVLGPESSGTRLMARLLMCAGCYGDDGHDQRLDDGIPQEEPLIVWRRSVPHRREWPRIEGCIERLEDASYWVTVVVMSRDWHAMAISQEGQHAPDLQTALENIRRAYLHIFNALSFRRDIPFELVNYEAIVQRPIGTVTYLFQRLGLPVPDRIPNVYDGNARYYREVEYVA